MQIIRINAIWCSGCLVMKKIWKEIEQEYNLDVTDYDYDFDSDIVKTYDVGKILPVIIFKKNNQENRLIGEQKKETIINIIESM